MNACCLLLPSVLLQGDAGFWMNRIKSFAYATFQSAESAARAKAKLEGKVWPDVGQRKLSADYSPNVTASQARNLEDGEGGRGGGGGGKSAVTSSSGAPEETGRGVRGGVKGTIGAKSSSQPGPREQLDDEARARAEVLKTLQSKKKKQTAEGGLNKSKATAGSNRANGGGHVGDGSAADGKEGSSRDSHLQSTVTSNDTSKGVAKKIRGRGAYASLGPPAKLGIDDVFRKTETEPFIYWLPHTEAEVKRSPKKPKLGR
uniref:Uncharacterized protein n=1 Tax=Octactis speculum TaxID=3111310 RepID=A0A7S2F9P6_9STRA